MRLSRVLLAALLALGHPSSAGGRVVAVWTDIEAIMGGRGTPNATTLPAAADVARSERFIEVITTPRPWRTQGASGWPWTRTPRGRAASRPLGRCGRCTSR